MARFMPLFRPADECCFDGPARNRAHLESSGLVQPGGLPQMAPPGGRIAEKKAERHLPPGGAGIGSGLTAGVIDQDPLVLGRWDFQPYSRKAPWPPLT